MENHIEQKNKNIPKLLKKTELCRFFLRGLCIFESKKCDFAHSIPDLNYQQWTQDQIVEYEYQKQLDKKQNKIIKGPIIYKNLYQFQTEKIFTLQQINENRPIRSEIRNLMYQKLYIDFMNLLQSKYAPEVFTEEFLLRQFTRVGFNKPVNRLKLTHITSYLCDPPGSIYFKLAINLDPKFKKETNMIVRKAGQEQITAYYKNLYLNIIKNIEGEPEQAVIKKQMFKAKPPTIHIPPINHYLKEKKIAFSELIKLFNGQNQQVNIKFEVTPDILLETAIKYLQKEIKESILSWNELFNYLSKSHKINNGNIINQIKPMLVLQGYKFLFFPMIQFIYKEGVSNVFKQNIKPCSCKYQQKFQKDQLFFDQMNWQKELVDGQSYDIYDFETLMQCAPHLLKSKVIGVDLEGRLRKGGFVEMIQLNNEKNTFLIDIWHMNQEGDFETFWLTRKILRNIMVDDQILKIFHDCRHDSLGLHEMIETCVINVFDTSASQTLIQQLASYSTLPIEANNKLALAKNLISECNNVKTPGLNEIFTKYEATHGINKNKDKFHKMWAKGEISFFCKRPLDPDYREYCIKDVLDLPQIYSKMMKQIPNDAISIAYWISSQYSNHGYLYLVEQPTAKEK